MSTLTKRHLYIGGRFTVPIGNRAIKVVSPVSEQAIGFAAAAGRADIDAAVAAARTAFDHGDWPRLPVAERQVLLARLASLLERDATDLAELITAETGSPIRFSHAAQLPHPIEILWQHAAYDLPEARRRRDLTVTGRPVGTVAAITPWNMPLKTIVMKLAPALLAGCTVVVKPAPETPLDALALAELVHEAGLPPGVVNVVPAVPAVARHLAAHPDIDKIAFTGSTATGATIAAVAAARCARVSLELGGKSAAILLPDGDLDAMVASLKAESFTMSGQICSAYTRILVPAPLLPDATEAMLAMMSTLTIGDPADPDTDIGPLIAQRQQHRVRAFLTAAADDGATAIEVGAVPDTGWWVPPTLVVNADPRSSIAQHEVFGPVVSLHGYDSPAHAVALANGTIYGLEAGLYTANPTWAAQLAAQLRVGTVRINAAPAPLDAPLGGFKRSGIGRELGPEALAGYLETQAVIS